MSGAPVGFGVLGAGSFVAGRAVLPAIDASPSCRLVAAASRSGPVPARWADAAVDDYDDVLAHPDVEAVYLPLPNGLHREWTERAAAAGKHVLCEKPLAPDAETARAMVGACRDAGVLLAEAWMTPFHPRFARALELARSGAIGTVTHVDGRFTFTIGPEAASNYRWDADQGGGALLDVGIYALGAAVELLGADPVDVAASSTSEHGVDASTTAELRWAGGETAAITCSFVDDEAQELRIVGDDGELGIDDEAFTGGADDRRLRVASHGRERIDDVPGRDPYRAMVEAFADAVRGRSPWPRPAERSVELLELLDRIRRAAVPEGSDDRPTPRGAGGAGREPAEAGRG